MRPKKSDNLPHLIGIDIGTVQSKIAVFDYSGGTPSVIGYARVDQPESAIIDGVVIDPRLAAEVLNKGIAEATASVQERPKKVIFGLSGVWVCNFTTVARISRALPETPITERELTEISGQVEDAAGIQVASEAARLVGEVDAELELVNSAITTSKIDGFYVSDPLNYRGENVEIGIYTAFSPTKYLDCLKKIAKRIHLNILTVSSSFHALLRSLIIEDISEFNALFIDVGGKVTDVGVVIGGGLVASRSFPIGDWHFVKSVSEGLGIGFPEAEEALRLYIRGGRSTIDDSKINSECHEGVGGDLGSDLARQMSSEANPRLGADLNKVGSIMTHDLRDWSIGLETVLESFSGVRSFPNKVYLLGGSAYTPEVAAVLSDSMWTRKFPFSQELKPHILSLKELRVKDLTGQATDPGDILPVCLGQVGKELLG